MQLRPFTTGNAAAQRWSLGGAGAGRPRARPLQVYRHRPGPMTWAPAAAAPPRGAAGPLAAHWRRPPASGPPVSGAPTKNRPRRDRTVRITVRISAAAPDRNTMTQDRPPRHRQDPAPPGPLERHRPWPDRRLRRPRGRFRPDRRHSGRRSRRAHHAADPRRHAHGAGPRPRAGPSPPSASTCSWASPGCRSSAAGAAGSASSPAPPRATSSASCWPPRRWAG